MQLPPWNLLYASSLPPLAAQLPALASTDVDGVRALLLATDDVDFGSAAWFLTTQCGPDVRTGLRTGGRQGWEAYLAGCVHAPATGERVAVWERAARVLGVGGA